MGNIKLKHVGAEERKELEEKTHKMTVEPFHLTDSNFNEIVGRKPIALIDFWAPWCGPCLAFAPTIDELAKEYSGKVFVGKLNVDENPETAKRFQIFSIPTIVIIKNGREVERIIGVVPKKQIEALIKKHLE